MPYKDKNRARAYQREYQRRRRSGTQAQAKAESNNARVGLTGRSKTLQLQTLDDLRAVFERVTNEVLNAKDLDPGVKGRVLGQLLTVGMKLIEGTDLERRIQALENARGEHAS
jgi:hypothetical protein